MNELSRLSDREVTDMLRRRSARPAPDGLASAVLASLASERARHPVRTAGRSAKRPLVLLAAAALLLVGGAMAAGSGLVRLPSVVPPMPAPTLPVAVTSPTAVPTASPAPSETSALVQPRAASWTATGSMVTPREGHTATLLPDGKVLVTGGFNRTSGKPNGTILASAELYDPGSGSWSATGSMSAARENHTATLLPDGKVLVVGGYSVTSATPNGTTLASAELYDPATETWSATGSMSTARESHTATLLPDGRVLVVGGYTVTFVNPNGTDSTQRDSAELYDPASGTWTATGKMVYGGGTAIGDTATLLLDGRVLVAGGNSSSGSFGGVGITGDTAELYDPSSGTWSATGKMVSARSGQTATLLPDGKVLVACGCANAGCAAETYDPTTGSWTATGTMVAGHGPSYPSQLPDGLVTATLLADGKVLVAGGPPRTPTSAERYDPETRSWAATSEMLAMRVKHTATLLPDGRVLVAGGSAAPSANLYDPGSRR